MGVPAVFIRAPVIAAVGPDVQVWARVRLAEGQAEGQAEDRAEDRAVAVRQGLLLDISTIASSGIIFE